MYINFQLCNVCIPPEGLTSSHHATARASPRAARTGFFARSRRVERRRREDEGEVRVNTCRYDKDKNNKTSTVR